MQIILATYPAGRSALATDPTTCGV